MSNQEQYKRKNEQKAGKERNIIKAEEELKEEYQNKKTFYNQNKILLQDENESIQDKVKSELSNFDAEIDVKKNILKNNIIDALENLKNINSMIRKYITSTDTFAKTQIELLEGVKGRKIYNLDGVKTVDEPGKIEKLQKELEELKKQRDMYPEYEREYTEKGKSEYKEIEDKIKDKEQEIEDSKFELNMYKNRADLLAEYQENIKQIQKYTELAKKYSLQIEPEQKQPGSSTHGNPTQGNSTQGNPAPGSPTQGNPAPGSPTQGNSTQSNPTQGSPTQGSPTQSNPAPIKSTLPSDVKIIIGRKGKITYEGKEYKINKKTIKDSLKLSETATEHMIGEIIKLNPNRAYIIQEGIKNKVIDSTVINSIYSSEMKTEEKKELLMQYIRDAANAMGGKDYKNNCNLTYDRKDLSKFNIFSRIFKKEINAQDKVEMLDRASIGERYAIAKQEGEYKPDKLSKFVAFFTRKKVPLLSDKIANEQEIATEYNTIRENVDYKDHKAFEAALKSNTNISKEQQNEIMDLNSSQVQQEAEAEQEH